MTLNQQALQIAKYFFDQTGRRATPGTMRMSIGQVKNLINNSYTPEEIIQGIDWYILHPPRNGFTSIGWLSYDLENALIKIKANKIRNYVEKKQQGVVEVEPEEEVKINKTKIRSNSERAGKGFDFNIFGTDKVGD